MEGRVLGEISVSNYTTIISCEHLAECSVNILSLHVNSCTHSTWDTYLHTHVHTSDDASSESVAPASASCSAISLLLLASKAGDWGTVTGMVRFSGKP